MDCEGIAGVKPGWFFHLARLLSEDAKSVAVAAYNILRLDHFLFEFGIRGYDLVSAVIRFDEQKTLPFSSVQALEQFFGRITPRELPNLRTLSSTMVITIVITFDIECTNWV
jgi:hypothetical protein